MSVQLPPPAAKEPATFGQQMCVSALCSPVIGGIGYAVGYLSAWAFTAVNPPFAGAFCATNAVINAFVKPVFDQFISSKNHPVAANVLSGAVSVITSITLAKVLLDAAGISLTVGNIASIIAANLALGLAVGGVVVVAALVGLCCCACFCPGVLPEGEESSLISQA